MTAVASPPSLTQLSRPPWGISGGQSLNGMSADEFNRMFAAPRKGIPRTNSSSSISSNSSTSSTSTVLTAPQSNGTPASSSGEAPSWSSAAQRKRPQQKSPWQTGKAESPSDFARLSAARGQLLGGLNGTSSGLHSSAGLIQGQGVGQGMQRSMADQMPPQGQPVLYLLSLNGTFERKTISVPFYPDSLRIGRQTNQKTVPTPSNGFFDSKVLSRQHAEIWADRSGKIWIRDVKSSNGTFVNGTRLSQENRESEPHELQTADHLELGIDIVSEDQKTVVHHKVAAKVEHAGFLNPASTVLDMNFPDLDPSLMPGQPAMQFRGRSGSQASLASSGRMGPSGGIMGQANGMNHQRPFWLAPVTTEHIVRKLQDQMRTARLQSEDLKRTNQFINALLSKDDVKDQEKPEVPDPPKPSLVNGNSLSFRSEGKARFDPPAPPPQQPLPETPDVPALKRGVTERPKSHPSNTSPIRPDSQIFQLTEALATARKEIEGHSARVRELEETLKKEREAREVAEDLARRLEESALAKINGSAKANGDESVLEEAFEPPVEPARSPDVEAPTSDSGKSMPDPAETTESVAALFQAKLDAMMAEIQSLKQQVEAQKQRAETAEAERDAERKTLAEMVAQFRREEEARRAAATAAAATAAAAEQEKRRSRSRSRRSSSSRGRRQRRESASVAADTSAEATQEAPQGVVAAPDVPCDTPVLSRANTITPQTGRQLQPVQGDQLLMQSLPYASMIGVVLIGMGLMAYINGWQVQPRVEQ